MKHRIIILVLALIGLTTYCVANHTHKTANTSIVGTWVHQEYDGDLDYYQFNADGTGYEWESTKYASKNFTPRKKSFKYEIQGNRIIFMEPDGDVDAESLRILSKDRIRIDHDTYRRVK